MHLKIDKLIAKSVKGITIQLYASLIAASNFTTDIYSPQGGYKLLDKIRYF